MNRPPFRPATGVGLVLSGGGVRGAYEAGVLSGLFDVLRPSTKPMFEVISGASVGAINAAHLAANAHSAEQGIDELVRTWRSLCVDTHLRPRVRSFIRWGREAPEYTAELGSPPRVEVGARAAEVDAFFRAESEVVRAHAT